MAKKKTMPWEMGQAPVNKKDIMSIAQQPNPALNTINQNLQVPEALQYKPKPLPEPTQPTQLNIPQLKEQVTPKVKDYPQPETRQEIHNADGSVTYKIGKYEKTLNKAEYQAYLNQQKGWTGSALEGQPPLTSNVTELQNYLEALNLSEAEARKASGIPEQIKNKEQWDFYNQLKPNPLAAEIDTLTAKIQEEQGKEVQPFQETEGGLGQAATFGATSAASAAGATKVAGIAGLVGGTIGGAATGGAAALGFAAGTIANMRKARIQNIKNAKAQTTTSLGDINKLISYANSGQFPKEALIEAFEQQRRDVEAARVYLATRSWKDSTFFVNEAMDELTKIDQWKETVEGTGTSMEMLQVQQFYQAIFNPNPAMVDPKAFEVAPETEVNQNE